jgi:hypothetical protein
MALEATGDFETVATAGLSAAGLPVVVNHVQVRALAQALGKRTKIVRLSETLDVEVCSIKIAIRDCDNCIYTRYYADRGRNLPHLGRGTAPTGD